jgi:hypothetical protein
LETRANTTFELYFRALKKGFFGALLGVYSGFFLCLKTLKTAPMLRCSIFGSKKPQYSHPFAGM